MTTDVQVRDAFVEANGLRLHYRDWGDAKAPPLVLLHGVTGHARVWDGFALAMADRFRVIALDQRGHGESDWADGYGTERMAEDVGAFAEALELGRFSLLGHSMGAINAYTFAGRHPEALERLVIVDFGPETRGSPTSDRVRAGLAVAQTAAFASPEEPIRAARALNPRPSDEYLRNRILNNLKQREDGRWVWRCDAAGLANRSAPLSPETQWKLLAQIACPTLVVRGAESDALEESTARRMAEVLPYGRWVAVPEAGHGIPADNPAGFLAAVRPFLLGDH
jgi:pimeloyl-ACP methyl ester carboxylesterase